jgi:hypothetical protein
MRCKIAQGGGLKIIASLVTIAAIRAIGAEEPDWAAIRIARTSKIFCKGTLEL